MENISDDRLSYRRQKTEGTGGVEIDMPIHPRLQAVLATCSRTAFTFLQTRNGTSRSSNGLGNDTRGWCDKAGLPNCSSHGLRKAIAGRMAEAGATSQEIVAVTGHETLAEVERYTKDVSRSKLGTGAMGKPARN